MEYILLACLKLVSHLHGLVQLTSASVSMGAKELQEDVGICA